VIIPNRNGGATIDRCLEAVFSSAHHRFEVVVVDDCSSDDSTDRIRRFPCRLVELKTHSGAAVARNVGARHARGSILFFTDADCLLERETLRVAQRTLEKAGPNAVVGGTYSEKSVENSFFGTFQSVFINYFETKRHGDPDYVATHAMALYADTFSRRGGFPADFLPILEDVEFSHRLREAGCRLLIDPNVVVRHIFNYSLGGSLKNAWRKSRYWTIYSIRNKDLLADSGTASRELKANVVVCFLCLGAAFLQTVINEPLLTRGILSAFALNIFFNRGLLLAFFRTGGGLFGFAASAYYLSLYPLAVGTGALGGLLDRSTAWRPAEKRR
jgi:glycosyltransferase involved in cell wall biosynthesis